MSRTSAQLTKTALPLMLALVLSASALLRIQAEDAPGLVVAPTPAAVATPPPTPTPAAHADTHTPTAAASEEPANAVVTDDDADAVQPMLVSKESGQGSISLTPGAKNFERKGVRFRYEHVKILCDHVDYWLSNVPGAKNEVLDHAFFSSGPDAVAFCGSDVPDDHHIVFDSRESKLPKISFRGLMEPESTEINRLALDPLKPKVVRFRIQLHRLDDFAGDLRTSNGWKPFAGYADEAEIVMVSDITPSGLTNQRFVSVILHGRPYKVGVPKKRARFERLKLPSPPGMAMKLLHDREKNWYVTGPLIIILFDEEGKLESLVNDDESEFVGTPSDDLGTTHSSKPAQGPTPAPVH